MLMGEVQPKAKELLRDRKKEGGAAPVAALGGCKSEFG